MALTPVTVMVLTVLVSDLPPSGFFPTHGAIYPPPNDAFRRMAPPTVVWTAWWEANRDPYLATARRSPKGKVDPTKRASVRKLAREALLDALKAEDKRIQIAAAVALGRMRAAEVMQPLTIMLRSDFPRIRQAGIIAIALADTPEAEAFLADLAFNHRPDPPNAYDSRANERQTALTALGLMSQLSNNSRSKLVEFANACRDVTITPKSAWTMTRPIDPADLLNRHALSLTDSAQTAEPSPKLCIAAGSHMAATAIAFKTLSTGKTKGATEVAFKALLHTNAPWLASEAMLHLGQCGNENAVEVLSEILAGSKGSRALPLMTMLDGQAERMADLQKARRSAAVVRDMVRGYAKAGEEEGRQRYIRAFNEAITSWRMKRWRRPPPYEAVAGRDYLRTRTYLQLHSSGERVETVFYERVPGVGGVEIYEHDWLDYSLLNDRKGQPNTFYYMNMDVERAVEAQLRASAAIALERIGDQASRTALLRALGLKDDEFSDVYKAAAIMALGRLGDEPAASTLARLVRPRSSAAPKLRQSPLRGFAALALGLSARGDASPKLREQIGSLLAGQLADRRESPALRAACAMGLGLTDRAENLKRLHDAWGPIGAENVAIVGHAILARAMLGDKEIVEPARLLLDLPINQHSMEGVLGRRAAVLALGLIGTPEAISVLDACRDGNRHVTREKALASALCGNLAAAARHTMILQSQATTEAKIAAAACLGEILSERYPSPLAGLINGDNYLFWTPRLGFFKAMANDFLGNHLGPALGEQWETIH